MAESRCRNCGEPAARSYSGWLLCEKCASRFEEYDRNSDAHNAGLLSWNTSQHDPFWRGWLTSWELFATIRDNAPRVGKRIHRLAGGDVFECLRGVYDCWLQVWVAETEVVVAYPTFGELHGRPDVDGWTDVNEGLHEFEGWVEHLRHSPPLELGFVRGRSSYGAASAGVSVPPIVNWSQAGDWAAMARTWFIGDGRQLAPWP